MREVPLAQDVHRFIVVLLVGPHTRIAHLHLGLARTRRQMERATRDVRLPYPLQPHTLHSCHERGEVRYPPHQPELGLDLCLVGTKQSLQRGWQVNA